MNFPQPSLYFVASSSYQKGRLTQKVLEEAIGGGVDIIQMREKNMDNLKLRAWGKKIRQVCERHNVIFMVNDDPYLAKALNAQGVHLGQEDKQKFSVSFTRKLLGKDKMIGVSTHSLEQFKQANCEDFNYIAFGPIFATKTKDYSIGTKDIETVLATAKKPVVFIGGINLRNIDELLQLGAKNIAVIRAISEARDITNSARKLKDKILQYADKN